MAESICPSIRIRLQRVRRHQVVRKRLDVFVDYIILLTRVKRLLLEVGFEPTSGGSKPPWIVRTTTLECKHLAGLEPTTCPSEADCSSN